ncbi:MAG TPA: class I SAM-dependent methyltransferase [Balneolaceae bacterium]|nr:class I SAM-dependent methyltransferase [Balneolaceae bacterium]
MHRLKIDINRLRLLIPVAIWAVVLFPGLTKCQNLDVPYVPTPKAVVEGMLDIANVQPCDYVIDLGSGDGRIVIAAAKRGAFAHGIDLDPERISEARENAANAGVTDHVMFKRENIFTTDFSQATVVTMYLLPSVNKKIRTKLLDRLEPGTRIVSHSFDMGEWEPDKRVTVDDNGGSMHEIYYWIIPAKVEGTWQWSSDGINFSMTARQNFQNISLTLSDDGGSSYNIKEALLQGKRISIWAKNGTHNYVFSGEIAENHIHGILQNHNGDDKNFESWEATKIED